MLQLDLVPLPLIFRQPICIRGEGSDASAGRGAGAGAEVVLLRLQVTIEKSVVWFTRRLSLNVVRSVCPGL